MDVGIALVLHVLAVVVAAVRGGVLPPPWADPERNPCADQPGGWLLVRWPKDGKCYRIFQRGSPCPDTMELTPAEDADGKITGECRCPPRTAQGDSTDACHVIFTRGPCPRGQYFAPIPSTSGGRFGHCLDMEQCRQNEIFWPQTGECFPKFSRGPCPEGQLIVVNKDTQISECGCSESGSLAKYYWSPTRTCHQYYTRGPCLEKGTLFLPGPTCGCHRFLPNYDADTERCYEIGGPGPCKPGNRFVLNAETMKASCACKPEHVPWHDGRCFRLYTRGPCQKHEILLSNSTCRSHPCPRGKLFFPEDESCHKVGVRGPCAGGQLVLFEQNIKPSVEGISYRGICGCSQSSNCDDGAVSVESRHILGGKEVAAAAAAAAPDAPEIRVCDKTEDPEIDSCHLLYTEGPCAKGEWLVPVRQSRDRSQVHRFESQTGTQLYRDSVRKTQFRCDCKPGYSKDKRQDGCRIPLFALAQFLNGKDLFR